ncbi:MAG TPA: hypothetical protein VK478_09675 [Gemmatimonadaceae bacterium]|nr:hypothetical protein [Gemmatimonadaceae bacterium]
MNERRSMNSGHTSRVRTSILLAAALLAGGAISSAEAQNQLVRRVGDDSVIVIAGANFKAGSLHRYFLGDEYRDFWTTPIKVPVLDLRTFHGGLRPVKEGGGMQAKSLRFVAPDSSEYVFRQVRKTKTFLGPEYDGTIISWIVRDQGAASHPAAAIAGAPMLRATDVLHPTPKLFYMPDDPLLGEFRKDFAGVLGMVEEYPSVPKKGRAFADADKIIDSQELLDRINKDSKDQVEARDFLTARMMDLLLGDNDRHPDQWAWARLGKGDGARWEPIPRDRDKVFVSYEGVVLSLARKAVPSLVNFRSEYSDPTALFANAGEFDRRLLGSLDKAVWDSVATSLMQRLTDPVIDNAVRAMPPEYAPYSREVAARLKARRNGLREASDRYYRELWRTADIHGTDADDQATVVRSADGFVDVRIQSGNDPPYFSRRFNANETKEIRVYLHGGDDQARVEGSVRRSIKVRIIGGNGNNNLVDLSTVGGKRNPTRLYDVGNVQNVKYARDTVDEKLNIDDALNHYFNRRPWTHNYGTLIPPQTDRGSSVKPVIGIHSQRGLGIYPVIGFAHYAYGFRKVPYAIMQQADFAYATGGNRFRVRSAFDKRFTESDTHIPVTAYMSQFEVVQFHGFGNDVADLRGRFYDVKQTQWQFNPAIGRSFSPVSDISLGPIVRYTTTDSVATRLISQQQPYGFRKFGQAGLRLKAHLDSRYYPDTMKPRVVVDLTGSGFPAMWDVNKPYESLDGYIAAFFTLPAPKKPVLALRAGGKKLWGPFPYFDAAFLGGSESYRAEEKQRFAGDASAYGTAELRVPIAKFPLILPLDVGALGFVDMGRVYLNGDSPGGWHKTAGGGLWIGYLNPGTNVNILFTNNPQRRVTSSFGFAF